MVDTISRTSSPENEQFSPPQSATGLFSLSAELRNEIYHHILVSRKEIRLTTCVIKSTGKTILLGQGAAEPAWLRTNKQIRAEALPIFYGSNVFRSFEQQALVMWLRALGPERIRFLKQVRGFCQDAETVEVARAVVSKFEEFVEREVGAPLGRDVFRTCFKARPRTGREFWIASSGDVVLISKGKEHTVGEIAIRSDEPLDLGWVWGESAIRQNFR